MFNLDTNDYQVTKASIHYTKGRGQTGNEKWVQAGAELMVFDTLQGRYIATSEVLSEDVRHWFVNLDVLITEINRTYTVGSSLFSN